MAPFFPQEALRRGLSETDIGFILGAFAITTFFMSMAFGRRESDQNSLRFSRYTDLCYAYKLVTYRSILAKRTIICSRP